MDDGPLITIHCTQKSREIFAKEPSASNSLLQHIFQCKKKNSFLLHIMSTYTDSLTHSRHHRNKTHSLQNDLRKTKQQHPPPNLKLYQSYNHLKLTYTLDITHPSNITNIKSTYSHIPMMQLPH